MRIRYERTLDDLMAFHAFHLKTSPAAKRAIERYRWSGAITLFVITSISLLWGFPGFPVWLSLFLAFAEAVTFAALAPTIVKRKSMKSSLKAYRESKNATFLGEQELEVTDTGLIAKSDYTETKLAWGAIERIETSPDYTFLYITPVQAYIIPHNRIIEGDYPALMAEIGRRFQPGQRLERTTS